MSRASKPFRFVLFLRTWHRRLGLFAFLMVVWLAVSGVLINHSDELGFNKQLLKNDWLKVIYGLNQAPEKRMVYGNGRQYFHCYENNFYVDIDKYAACGTALEHFVKTRDYFVLANEQEMFVLDTTGKFLEKIELTDFSLLLHRAYVLEDNNMVLMGENQQAYLMNLDNLSLEKFYSVLDESKIAEPAKTEFPAVLQTELEFPGIHVERILLDLHSGRLFGKAGVWVVDFFALLFVVLSFGGLCIFLYQRR